VASLSTEGPATPASVWLSLNPADAGLGARIVVPTLLARERARSAAHNPDAGAFLYYMADSCFFDLRRLPRDAIELTVAFMIPVVQLRTRKKTPRKAPRPRRTLVQVGLLDTSSTVTGLVMIEKPRLDEFFAVADAHWCTLNPALPLDGARVLCSFIYMARRQTDGEHPRWAQLPASDNGPDVVALISMRPAPPPPDLPDPRRRVMEWRQERHWIGITRATRLRAAVSQAEAAAVRSLHNGSGDPLATDQHNLVEMDSAELSHPPQCAAAEGLGYDYLARLFSYAAQRGGADGRLVRRAFWPLGLAGLMHLPEEQQAWLAADAAWPDAESDIRLSLLRLASATERAWKLACLEHPRCSPILAEMIGGLVGQLHRNSR
jgi:hypothetical protein